MKKEPIEIEIVKGKWVMCRRWARLKDGWIEWHIGNDSGIKPPGKWRVKGCGTRGCEVQRRGRW